jgi:hypothetical protein
MVTLDQLADAALHREGLRLRSLAQDFLAAQPQWREVARPALDDPRQLTTAAALVELFAARLGQAPPEWTKDGGPLPEPFFLVAAAESMQRLRTLCAAASPEPLRKRRLYAPPNFLEFA